MSYVKCPVCGHIDFTQDPEGDPDYYNCAKCETQIIINVGGFLTLTQREFLLRMEDKNARKEFLLRKEDKNA